MSLPPPATNLSRMYSKPFFGWPIILACFVGMFGNVGPLIYASFGFVVQSLEAEFGWNRSGMTLSISLLTLVSAAIHPTFGSLVDRYGVRRTMIPSLTLMALILITVPLYLNQLWQLWVIFPLVAIFGAANNNLSFIRTVSAWYDSRRGLMIGLIASGTGVGLAFLPKITALVVSWQGWQGGFVFYGLYILLITIPVMYLFIRDTPQKVGLQVDDGANDQAVADENNESGLSLHDALRTQGFWLLFFAVLFASAALWGITNQMAFLLADKGFSAMQASSVVMVLGISMAVSRLVVGYLLDKVFAPVAGATIFTLTAIGFAILAYVETSWAPFLAAALMGAGIGAETELMGYMASRYFGLRRFGSIYGLIFVGFLLGTSGGPYLYAKTQEIFGSYYPVLKSMVVLMMITAAMFAFMGRYDRYHAKFARDV